MRPRVSLLDFKLGARMMAKQPGLTLVGVVALTVAIGLSATWFEFTKDMLRPSLPLDDAGRIVAIENWDAAKSEPERKTLHDYQSWRAELRSVEDVSAASSLEYALVANDGRSASVSGAQMTASGFRVTRVKPLLGRPLMDADEREGAPPVVVIGYDVWQRLFDGDRGVVGRTLRVGNLASTVVGVMPEGFGFPVNQQVWAPFLADALQHERRAGPAILVFGRLAEGRTLAQAQAELTAIGGRTAAAFPATNRQLRPRVLGFVEALNGQSALVLPMINVPFLLLMLVISANVATLVFARTVTRHGELVTRSALGASRGRLIAQLFTEALVLTLTAALIGLAGAAWATDRGMDLFFQTQGSRPPFWVDGRLSLATVAYAFALAVFGAALVGAVPALKATGRNLRAGLSQTGIGGTRLRFGAISTTVIVVQIALSMIFLPIALVRAQDALGGRIESIGFPAGEYLSGRLTRQLDAPLSAMTADERNLFAARTAQLQDEARRRLAGTPGVSGVAFASRVPGMNHPYEALRLDNPAVPPDSVADNWARALSVDLAFFDVMEAPIVSGRGFRPSDLGSGIGVAIVDETFVRDYLRGRNPVGQRLRYPRRTEREGERWYEIVGVVKDLAMNAYGPGGYQDIVQTGPAGYVGVYHPLQPGEAPAVQLFLRTRTPNPGALVPAIQSTITSLDPTLSVQELMRLDEVWGPSHRGERMLAGILAFVAAIVVTLSAAGIYALVSFTVSQRTREIGIRTALGADPRRIILTIFSRALLQIGLGVLAGGVVFAFITGVETIGGAWLVVAMAAVMAGVGLLACVPPARRALRIQPTEALRADG